MPYSLVIFDLGGTLVDSFPWFLRNVNDVADRFGFRRVADGDVEALRHASTREILSRLEVPLWKLPVIARHMRRLKAEQAASIALFEGAEAVLRTLAAAGLRLALVSSDSEANARVKLGEAASLFDPLRLLRVDFRQGRQKARRRRRRAGDFDRRRNPGHRGRPRGRHRLRRGDMGIRGARSAEGAWARLDLRWDGRRRTRIDRVA
jgi:phosphoglycolate phosphatase